MGLGRLLMRSAERDTATRSTQYTATDTVTGATQTWTVVDNIAPEWATGGVYGPGMQIPAAWRAATLISDLLGQVPWEAFRKLGRDAPETLIYPNPPLLEQPAPPDARITTFSSSGLDLVWNGNAIWLVAARSPGNWPTAVVPVPAATVQVRRVGLYDRSPLRPGQIEYMVGDLRGLSHQDVIHIKGPCAPGALRGMGVIEQHYATIKLATEQKRQASSISSHGVPTGVLKSDNPDLDDDEAADLKAKWLVNQGTRSIAVLNASTTFEPLAWNPEELQMVEARKLTFTEWEQIFGLPLGWLGGQTSSRTYANIEQDAINLLRFTMGGHFGRFEQTLSLALPRGTICRAALDAFLRPDTLARFQAYRLALDPAAPFMTVDEVRELEHRPPMPTPAQPEPIPGVPDPFGVDQPVVPVLERA